MLISCLSIIIPTYNEENYITQILEKIKAVELPLNIKKEIIIVDDCSTDNTTDVVKNYMRNNSDITIQYLIQEKNTGKGAALRKGIKIATGDFLIIQDADLEYDPEDYNDMLQPVLKGFADVVYGSRFVSGKPHRVLFFWHSIGNKFLTWISNMFTNLNLTDMETCYKLFNRQLIQSLVLKENRFGFEPEVTAKIAKLPDIRIYEVGIAYYGRTYKEGKKIKWKDGLRAIYCILKYG